MPAITQGALTRSSPRARCRGGRFFVVTSPEPNPLPARGARSPDSLPGRSGRTTHRSSATVLHGRGLRPLDVNLKGFATSDSIRSMRPEARRSCSRRPQASWPPGKDPDPRDTGLERPRALQISSCGSRRARRRRTPAPERRARPPSRGANRQDGSAFGQGPMGRAFLPPRPHFLGPNGRNGANSRTSSTAPSGARRFAEGPVRAPDPRPGVPSRARGNRRRTTKKTILSARAPAQ